jgi:hypothetical protein
MPARQNPEAAAANEFGIIQVKSSDRGASACGSADEPQTRFAPGEMVIPGVSLRIEQLDAARGDRVTSYHMIALVIVTPPAAKAEVFVLACPAGAAGHDMINLAAANKKTERGTAVRAPIRKLLS